MKLQQAKTTEKDVVVSFLRALNPKEVEAAALERGSWGSSFAHDMLETLVEIAEESKWI